MQKAFPYGEGGTPTGVTEEEITSPAPYGGTLPKGEGISTTSETCKCLMHLFGFAPGVLLKS